MIDKILILILFVIIFTDISAQKSLKGAVTGIIVDSESKAPIEFANVFLVPVRKSETYSFPLIIFPMYN